jgi:acyl carrier protein phosphodiesterase
MNLLAHAVLSPNPGIVRVGNVVADFVTRTEQTALHPDLQEGFLLHYRIDTFTDRHPVVERAKQRLVGYQRFANPIIDVFFDHFLVMNWSSPKPLRDYVDELHEELAANRESLPTQAQDVLQRMIDDQWLLSYDTFDNLKLTLGRMENRIKFRTGRTEEMQSAARTLESNYEAFRNDFDEFWPELKNHIQND